MTSQSVIGLALLKVNWDHNKSDYISNFVPLLAECVRISDNDVISSIELQKEMESRFGLKVPVNVVETIIKRARRLGYLNYFERDRTYRPNRTKLEKLGFHKLQEQVLRKHDLLVGDLVSFSNSVFGKNGQKMMQRAHSYRIWINFN